jgi:hypothetical protein
LKSFARVNLCTRTSPLSHCFASQYPLPMQRPLTQPARRHQFPRRARSEIERPVPSSSTNTIFRLAMDLDPNARQIIAKRWGRSLCRISSVSTRARSSVKRRSRPLIQIPICPSELWKVYPESLSSNVASPARNAAEMKFRVAVTHFSAASFEPRLPSEFRVKSLSPSSMALPTMVLTNFLRSRVSAPKLGAQFRLYPPATSPRAR